mmetsp:Transcript_168/g.580  ORF Transcript_168/g.580 Transcript_168/m.580 type:complete len:203 (-) Transcript_168:1143-1751(-)
MAAARRSAGADPAAGRDVSSSRPRCLTTSRRSSARGATRAQAPRCSSWRMTMTLVEITRSSLARCSARAARLCAATSASRPPQTSSAASGCASATRPAARMALHTKALSGMRTYVCSSRRIAVVVSAVASEVKISSLSSRLKQASVAFTKKSLRYGANMSGRSEAMAEMERSTTYWISRRLRRMRTSALPSCAPDAEPRLPQ